MPHMLFVGGSADGRHIDVPQHVLKWYAETEINPPELTYPSDPTRTVPQQRYFNHELYRRVRFHFGGGLGRDVFAPLDVSEILIFERLVQGYRGL